MARTGGELLPSSFDAVFRADELVGRGGEGVTAASQGSTAADAAHAPPPPIRVFVDVGSGHGQIVRAAVEEGGFDRGIGIEKYREPQAIADAMHASLPPLTAARLSFTLADFGDCDLAAMVRGAATAAAAERRAGGVAGAGGDGEAAPSTPPQPSTSALVFINNLAFPPGVSLRHARQMAAVGRELGREGVRVTVVSSVPLPALEEAGAAAAAALPPPATLTLAMSFNPAHDARVYAA